MISVSIKENEDTEIEVLGHADDELVCAAVSGLFYALLGYLKESGCEIKELCVDSGDAKIVFEGTRKEAVKMFYAGISGIEKNHSSNLKAVK